MVRLFQGSVTEDKASSSYVVVPIPTSLEEGRPSWIELIYLNYQCFQNDVFSSHIFLIFVQRSGFGLWWKETSKCCSTGGIFQTGWCWVDRHSVSFKKLEETCASVLASLLWKFSFCTEIHSLKYLFKPKLIIYIDPWPVLLVIQLRHLDLSQWGRSCRGGSAHTRETQKGIFQHYCCFCCWIPSIPHAATEIIEFYPFSSTNVYWN